MSIEGSSTVGSHKAAASDAARLGKAKVAMGGADDSLARAGAGFSALLSSFDSAPVVDGVGNELPEKEESDLLLQTPANPAIALFLPQNLPTDLQLLLSQASQALVDKTNLLQPEALETKPAAAGILVPAFTITVQIGQVSQAGQISQATVAATTERAPASLLVPMSVSGNPDLAPLSSRLAPDMGTLTLPSGRSADAVSSTTKPVSSLLIPVDSFINTAVPADLLLLQPGLGTQSRAPRGKFLEGLAGMSASVPDSRMASLAASMDMTNRETSLLGAVVSSGPGEGGGQPGDRRGSQPSFFAAGSGAEGVWGQSSFQPGQSVDAGTVTTGAPASSVESMLADTVSYWVRQGVEHAALKLDGFGEMPLEVSISMQGGEAHIDFRTDHPEIRQMLEGASTQLKDLLKGEGVVLSGVSVGGSGQNASKRQDDRNRPGARQGTVVSTTLPSLDTLRPMSLPSGRVLDLFV